ncbi:hypothetical protein VD61_07720, partial [Campylobacter coli]|nr:hypothetical protein [Campylobacter coli]
MKKEEKIKQKEYNVFFYKLSVKPNLFNQENEIYNSMLKFLKINLRDRQLCDINGCKAYVNFIKEKNGIYLFYYKKYKQTKEIIEKAYFSVYWHNEKYTFYIAYIDILDSFEIDWLQDFFKILNIKKEQIIIKPISP